MTTPRHRADTAPVPVQHHEVAPRHAPVRVPTQISPRDSALLQVEIATDDRGERLLVLRAVVALAVIGMIAVVREAFFA
jgi:hypothetical protein